LIYYYRNKSDLISANLSNKDEKDKVYFLFNKKKLLSKIHRRDHNDLNNYNFINFKKSKIIQEKSNLYNKKSNFKNNNNQIYLENKFSKMKSKKGKNNNLNEIINENKVSKIKSKKSKNIEKNHELLNKKEKCLLNDFDLNSFNKRYKKYIFPFLDKNIETYPKINNRTNVLINRNININNNTIFNIYESNYNNQKNLITEETEKFFNLLSVIQFPILKKDLIIFLNKFYHAKPFSYFNDTELNKFYSVIQNLLRKLSLEEDDSVSLFFNNLFDPNEDKLNENKFITFNELIEMISISINSDPELNICSILDHNSLKNEKHSINKYGNTNINVFNKDENKENKENDFILNSLHDNNYFNFSEIKYKKIEKDLSISSKQIIVLYRTDTHQAFKTLDFKIKINENNFFYLKEKADTIISIIDNLIENNERNPLKLNIFLTCHKGSEDQILKDIKTNFEKKENFKIFILNEELQMNIFEDSRIDNNFEEQNNFVLDTNSYISNHFSGNEFHQLEQYLPFKDFFE